MQNTKQTTEQIHLCIALISFGLLLIVGHDFAVRAQLVKPNVVFEMMKANLFLLRLLFIGSLALTTAFPRSSLHQRKKPSVLTFILALIGALLTGLLFMSGYTRLLWYNLYIYPLATFLLIGCLVVVGAYLQHVFSIINIKEENMLATIHYDKANPIRLTTTKGPLSIPNPAMGFFIESAAGGGKSELMKSIFFQSVASGFAGVLYDYEGNIVDKEKGAILTKFVYSCVLNSGVKTEFAVLNFNDPTRTIRCNPFHKRYLKSALHVKEMITILMKNLEPDWAKKIDFWGNNAIALATGCTLMLQKIEGGKYCTIPHLVSLALSDFDVLMEFLSSDEEVAPFIQPILSAHRMKATQQTAGVASSAQLPLSKLHNPMLYWLFSPPEEKDFSLDVTNKKNPTILSIAFLPELSAALSPVVSCILSVIMNQMNQSGKQKAFFAIDELATIIIPNIDKFPATVRKHGVTTVFSVQTRAQLVETYGEQVAQSVIHNLSNQFLGKTNNYKAASELAQAFGQRKIFDTGYSSNDSGDSISKNAKLENYLQARDIMDQPSGHFTGKVANGKPPLFHSQFKMFEMKEYEIPVFSSNSNYSMYPVEEQVKRMEEDIKAHFTEVNNDIKRLLKTYES